MEYRFLLTNRLRKAIVIIECFHVLLASLLVFFDSLEDLLDVWIRGEFVLSKINDQYFIFDLLIWENSLATNPTPLGQYPGL